MRLILFLLTGLWLHAEVFYGGIRREGTNVFVTWSNAPPAIIVQGSTDMTNWVDLLSIARIGSTNRFESFEYRVGLDTNSTFMRLRTP